MLLLRLSLTGLELGVTKGCESLAFPPRAQLPYGTFHYTTHSLIVSSLVSPYIMQIGDFDHINSILSKQIDRLLRRTQRFAILLQLTIPSLCRGAVPLCSFNLIQQFFGYAINPINSLLSKVVAPLENVNFCDCAQQDFMYLSLDCCIPTAN